MDSLTRNLFILAIVVALVVFPLIYYGLVEIFEPPFKKMAVEKEKNMWGVTFSTYYAREVLGLDWKEAYLATIEQLHVKQLRVPLYWTEVEPRQNEFNFSDFDWIAEVAASHSAKIIFVVGQKQPRWPECFIPQWALNLSVEERQKATLNYIEKTVKRYKEIGSVEAWQVENEPLFSWFGSCPDFSSSFFKEEAKFVKSLDNRPVVITDSGEWGTWVAAARRGDILGSTLYRQVWNPVLGDVYHIFPAFFYNFKASWTKVFAPGRKVWDVELQMEPWSRVSLPDTDIAKQTELMNKKVFIKNLKFAKATSFERHYLWGVEWWYWMKVKHGNHEMWDVGKKLFVEGYEATVE